MIDIKIFPKLHTALDEFNKNELDKELKVKALVFLNEHEDLLESEGLPFSEYSHLLRKGSLSKERLISIIAIPFSSKNLYNAWRKTLPDEVCDIWDTLIFEKQLHEETIRKRWNVDIVLKRDRYWYGNLLDRLIKKLRMFQTVRAGSWADPELIISLPFQLRVLLKNYYEVPDEARLKIMPTCPKTDFVYEEGAQTILSELSRLYLYYSQGQIPLTGKHRPKLTSLNKIKKTLSLREFFSPSEKDKKLANLRTNILAALIIFTSNNGGNWLTFLKKELLEKSLLFGTDTPAILLNDLKGMGHVDKHGLNEVEKFYYQFFQAIPHKEKGWVDIEQLWNSARFNLLPMEPISRWVAKERLYYDYNAKIEERGYEYHQRKHYITDKRYRDAVSRAYFNASVFMYAAIGVFDIAFDRPDRTIVGKTCFSAYDGLRYFRLTDLGAYLFGHTDHYEIESLEKATSLSFSPDALTITVDGKDPALTFILKPYTRQLGANRFVTDSKLFLNGIKSKTQLEQKIKMFREVTGAEFPPNWEAFFNDMTLKVNPFAPVDEQMILYKLPADNRPLIQLIARDNVIKKMVLKAEDYHILIPRSKLPVFKKRLAEFGYLVT